MSFSSSSSSRDTSPDPIVLPSSPLGNRSARKATPRRKSFNPRASPSKSLVLDTPGGNGGESPWRIRVTVEAEPSPGKNKVNRRSGSPGKKAITSTTTVLPLKGESPSKRGENTRKRKGTPIRRGRSSRWQGQTQASTSTADVGGGVDEPPMMTMESTTENHDEDMNFQEAATMPPPPLPTSSTASAKARRRTSGRIGRLNSQSAPTLRSQRLSLAREELDIALQDAVGYGEEHTLLEPVDFSKSVRIMGDATLSGHEDFSMVGVETLESVREESGMLGRSNGSASGLLGRSNGSGRAYVGGSSPPKQGSLRRSTGLGMPVEFGGTRSTLSGSQDFMRRSVYEKPVNSQTSTALGSPLEFGTSTSSERNGADVMSWKATGPAVVIRHLTPSSQLKHSSSHHIPRSTTSQPNLAASTSYGMDGVNDEDVSQGLEEDVDIWQTEASRQQSEPADQEDIDDGYQEDQLQSDAAAQSRAASVSKSRTHSPGLEDIFAGQPLRPARSKIPKTWRRSSGVDFSYIDSPAHVQEENNQQDDAVEEDDRRLSADGSGVLTPPTSSEDESEAEEGDAADDDMNDVEAGHDEDEDSEDEIQSEWNHPDAEATRYEQHPAADGDTPDTEHVISPLSDDEDTGDFFQHNMPQVYARQNRPGRPPPRRPRKEEDGTVDLTDLLGLKSSPVKKTPAVEAAQSSSGSAQRSARLHGGAFDGKMKLGPPPPAEQHQSTGSGGGSGRGKGKVVDSPLRKSLLKSSKVHGGSPDAKRMGRQGQMGDTAIGSSASRESHHDPDALTSSGSGRRGNEALVSDFLGAAPRRPYGRQQRHAQNEAPEATNSNAAVLPPAVLDRSTQKHFPHSILSPAVLDRSQTSFPNSQSRVEKELNNFAAKAHDQRQHVAEDRIGTGMAETGQSYEDSTSGQNFEEYTSEAGPSSPAPMIRSYEENLNLDSPQKVPVQFGDGSSLLPPTRAYLSRAGRRKSGGTARKEERVLIQPRPIPVVVKDDGKKSFGGAGGLFSRLTETFWSAVVRPTGPTEIYPQEPKFWNDASETSVMTPDVYNTATTEEDESGEIFNTTLRTAIRSRYGVLPDTFPWTMAHMRTLHRMLNSLASLRPDSLIPNAGPLPGFLEDVVDTEQGIVGGGQYLFTRDDAYVVFSFLQVLVPKDVVVGIERGDVEILGDELSMKLRGWDGEGRGGKDACFRNREWEVDGEEIGWEFVVAALGCAVRCNERQRQG